MIDPGRDATRRRPPSCGTFNLEIDVDRPVAGFSAATRPDGCHRPRVTQKARLVIMTNRPFLDEREVGILFRHP